MGSSGSPEGRGGAPLVSVRGLAPDEAARVHSHALDMAAGRGVGVLIVFALLVGLSLSGPGVIRRGFSFAAVGVVAMFVGSLAAAVGLAWLLRGDLRNYAVGPGEPVYRVDGRYWRGGKNTLPAIDEMRFEPALAEPPPPNGEHVVAEFVLRGPTPVVVVMRPAP